MQIDIERIAKLARLRLDEAEKRRYAAQLAAFADAAARLPALDGEAPAPDGADAAALRPDRAEPSLDARELLSNAPQAADGCFAVPRAVD